MEDKERIEKKNQALKVAIIVLSDIWPEDFESQFGTQNLREMLEDTKELKEENKLVEEILEEALNC